MIALRLGFLFAVLASPALAAVPDGTYCGTVESAGTLNEVVTEFTTSGGGIAGGYIFIDAGKPERGTLVTRDRALSPELTFLWADKYGSGRLVLRFDPDFGSFTGLWSANADPVTLRWDGKRCPAGSQPGTPT